VADVKEKTFDLSNVDDEGLEDSIRRHQEKGATDTPLYHALVQERARRKSKFLNFEKTIALLIKAAKRREFVTYKDVATASDIEFSKVHYQVGKHLDALLDVCHARRWPLLTALCVKQTEVKKGNLSGDSLKGFVASVRRLKIPVTDPETYLRECQDACFKWAETQ
jgi:hypothetical protein